MQESSPPPLTFEEVRRLVDNLHGVFSTEELRRFADDPKILAKRFARSLSPEEARALPVDALFKSPGTTSAKALVERGVNTLGELTEWSVSELNLIPGFGTGRLNAIADGLTVKGLSLADHKYSHVAGMSMWLFVPKAYKPWAGYRSDVELFLEDELGAQTIGDLIDVPVSTIENAPIREHDRSKLVELIKKLNKPFQL